MKKVAWFVLFLALAGSCLEEPNCIQSKNNNLVGVSFKTMFDGRGDTVLVVGVTASGTEALFDSLVAGTTISVPVNYLNNATSIAIQTLTRKYLLDLAYQAKPQFISPTCGEKYVLSNLSLRSATGMDSIKLVSSSLSNPAEANINIYRCPVNKLVKLSFRQWYMDTLSRGKLDTRAVASVTDDYSGLTYFNSTKVNTIYLPLNTSSGNTLFTVKFSDGTTRKLLLNYDLLTKTVLTTCGNQKFPRKLKVVSQGAGQDFEVIHLRRDSVYDPPKTNYETFRCPTTNQIIVQFKKSDGGSASDTLQTVTADYLGSAPIYTDTITSSLTLPLNPNSTSTTFNFKFNKKTSSLLLQYTPTGNIYHAECGTQQAFSQLSVLLFNGFSADPKITSTTVSFPASNNVEIVQ